MLFRSYLAAGVVNKDSTRKVSGEVWIDELRVTDVRSDVGTAARIDVSGRAADLIKIAMIRIDAEMQTRKMKSRMTLQVHDELVFEVAETELDDMKLLVREQMENAHPLTVPLVVEIGVGKNWRDLE